MDSPFVNLHTHSHYSLLSALPKVPELVTFAKEHGMNALALTDEMNLYGAIEFYKTCVKEGIKPILGAEVFVTPEEPQANNTNERPYDLVLLVKNQMGYQNLVTLLTNAQLTSGSESAKVTREELKKYHEGLICLSGSTFAEIPRALKRGDKQSAKETAKEYQDLFGTDSFYLEVTYHPGITKHDAAMQELKALSSELSIPLVASQDARYIQDDDKLAYNALLSIGGNERDQIASEDLSYGIIDKALEYFRDFPDAIDNTKKIADSTHIEFEFGNWVFPDYEIPEGTTYDNVLYERAQKGLAKLGMDKDPEAIDRLQYELTVIRNKGYSSYFLVVGDLLRHARKHGILSTIRGSVAGSLTTYVLGITKVNPLEYQLPFERFLNPERPSAPDIDMDYADNRRDEMLDYARAKYGEDHVAQIGTFGTMAARGAVRDIARALGYPYSVGDRIAKLIPFGAQGFPMTIDRALSEVSELKKLYEDEDEVSEIIDMAKKVEGCARHISVHAAGVVIAPRPLTEFVPLQHDPKGGKLITQFEFHAVEDVGLTKFDFLGIRNLAILADAIRLVKATENIDIDIENIPLDDQKAFDMLARGETVGLFQLGGSGMTKYLMELHPTTVHDINAMVALYRPGPMEFIPEYIRRKQNPKKVAYPHALLKDDLKRSFGLLVYQDDVMITAIKLAGYSWLEADMFRKAMGKKIPELMDEQEVKFKEGCKKNNIDKKTVDAIWEQIKPFASYGFNKAHAASYGRVAYQTAYMKANYPAPYMTAILTAESGDIEKIAEIVAECKRMNLPVLPPDVNESLGDFTIIETENDEGKKVPGIRFGLYTIKNLGTAISDAFVTERKRGGPFRGFPDLVERVNHKDLGKKSIEALILSGALDNLGERGQMRANLEDALLFIKEKNADLLKNQESLFTALGGGTFANFTMRDGAPMASDEKLKKEKELLGLFVSGHPLDKYRERLLKNDTDIAKLKDEGKDRQEKLIAGILDEVKPIMTKKGDKMAFLKLSDFTGTIELVIFPKSYEKYRALLEPDTCVIIQGTFSKRGGEPSLIVEKMKNL